MATITITLPDDQNVQLVTAVCANYGYQPTVPNPAFDPTQPVDPDTNPDVIANPVSPADFVSSKLIAWGTDHINAYNRAVAVQTAVAAVVPADASTVQIDVGE